MLREMAHEKTIGSKGKGLWGMPGKQLPAYIQHVYNDLVQGGKPTGSMTYRLAVGIVQNWASGRSGKTGKVKPETQAKAAKAIAEWEKLKAQRHSMTAKDKVTAGEEMVWSTDLDALYEAAAADVIRVQDAAGSEERLVLFLLEAEEDDPLREWVEEALLIIDGSSGPLRPAGPFDGLYEAAVKKRQPRMKKGTFTDRTRGVAKRKRNNADLMAELAAKGHAGDGKDAEPDADADD